MSIRISNLRMGLDEPESALPAQLARVLGVPLADLCHWRILRKSLDARVKDAFHFVGLPEGKIPLAQAVTYLATAPKSNASYKAMLAAANDVEDKGALPVPLHLRNAPTPLMEKLGYGKDYKYAHNFPDHVVEQEHLPKELSGRKYYSPLESGYEKQIQDRLKSWGEKKQRP